MANFDESTATAELVVSSAKASLQGLQRGERKVFSTMPEESFDDKRKVVALLTNATKIETDDPKTTLIGKPFKLAHFIVQLVEVKDDSGKMIEQTRVILVTDKGEAYDAISSGIMGGLETIMGMFGDPSEWPEPLPVQINVRRSRAGFRFFDLIVL